MSFRQPRQTAKLSNGAVDTVFLTTGLEYAYLSSSSVKEIASFGGDISMCVPDFLAKQIYDKVSESKRRNKHIRRQWI